MKGPDGFVQAYNAQIVVESEHQFIVGQAVTQEVNDRRQLTPMVETVVTQCGDRPTQVLADGGYCSETNLATLTTTDPDLYIATGRLKHVESIACPRHPPPKDATWTDRMRRKPHTKQGSDVIRWRKAIVEPVFGPNKHGRGYLGPRQQ